MFAFLMGVAECSLGGGGMIAGGEDGEGPAALTGPTGDPLLGVPRQNQVTADDLIDLSSTAEELGKALEREVQGG